MVLGACALLPKSKPGIQPVPLAIRRSLKHNRDIEGVSMCLRDKGNSWRSAVFQKVDLHEKRSEDRKAYPLAR